MSPIILIATASAAGAYLLWRHVRRSIKRNRLSRGTPIIVFTRSNGTTEHIFCSDDRELHQLMLGCMAQRQRREWWREAERH